MSAIRNRSSLIFLLLGALSLAGCDRLDKSMFEQMQQDVVIVEKPIQLRPQPITLTPDPVLEVRGKTSDLCFALADGVSLAGNGDAMDAREKEFLHGSKINILLHDDKGKTYPWTCGGWQLTPTSADYKVGRLFSCARWECNSARPPKGSRITSVDVSATPELRVLEITWSSTDAFDGFDKR
jgi:hypothetical protein